MRLQFRNCRILLLFTGLLSCAPSNWEPEIDAVMRHRTRPHIRASIKGSNSKVGRSRLKSSIKDPKLDQFKGQQDPTPSIVLRDNAHVRKFVNLYTGKKKRDLAEPLVRFDEYKPLIEKVFDYYNLPQELSNVALVESKFDKHAISEDGAVGIWQLMRPTAQELGLSCSFWNDERKDVLRSTIAAAKYLNDLNERFGDWLLALAAYNAGPNKIANAIERAGGERDFYKLASKNLLPTETVNHVSKFIAITMITKNPSVYQFSEKNTDVVGDQPLID